VGCGQFGSCEYRAGKVEAVVGSLILYTFPLYCLMRAAVKGFEDGLVARLPSKICALAATTGLYAYMTNRIAAANHLDRCLANRHAGGLFLGLFVPGLTAVLFASRYFAVNERIAQLMEEPPAAQNHPGIVANRVLGAVIEIVTTSWLMFATYDVLGFGHPNLFSWITEASLVAVPRDVGDLFGFGLPSPFEVSERLQTYVGIDGPSSCPIIRDRHGLLLPSVLGVLLLPACIALTFESILHFRALTHEPKMCFGERCSNCGGRGVYGFDDPLRVGRLCDSCFGHPCSTGEGGPLPNMQRIENGPCGLTFRGAMRTGFVSVLVLWLSTTLLHRILDW
jgi:hypothetical protein